MYKVLFTTILSLCIVSNTMKAQLTNKIYKSEIENWDKQRERNLKSENGWLNIIGLLWLADGENTFGTDTSCNIVFPYTKSIKKLGTISLKKGIVSMHITEGFNEIYYNNNIFHEGIIFTDTIQNAPVFSYKSLRWFIIKRGNKYGIRLRDLECEALANFTKISRFEIDEKWNIKAKYEPYNKNKMVGIKDVIGLTTTTELAGKLIFNIDGKEYWLDATQEGNKLFIVFADETSGAATYPAGRFLYADVPKDSQYTILDFNKAYNPPCAFTNYATCPLPLPQNILKVAITAGEKNYGHH